MLEIVRKRKALNGKYYDYLFQVTRYLQTQNLSKYAFYKLRDDAVEDIYEAQTNNVPVENIYKNGIDHHFERKAEKLPKMGLIEQIANLVMVFFAMFAVLALFVYVYRFIVKDELDYSKGIFLHLSIAYFRNMIIYGFLGAIVSIFLQKIDKKRKNIQAVIVGIVGVISFMIITALGQGGITSLKINIVIVIPIFIALAVLGYFINDFLAKKKYKNHVFDDEEK